ncbi:RBPJ-interacting and tubulin-associated protein 1 [Sceloporus undulatus]|uniref:RBPJ-interacting and tubulin-associated protein 1 n=1 Tax=Sceloporus undulatus TaxID=8520 RepID=UPI001C4D84A4|nr:RBPJ-interacting and tubulin-associated protein 1 [Sceloporus undulatus]XP_042297450.1 RBPJ-interacting and tubulin-associated protein 1 [Sceloporus undulatus]
MKASTVLGVQALQLRRKTRGSGVKAKASYVDESLFGSSTGRQAAATVAFDPPWVEKKSSSQRPLLWSPGKLPREVDSSPSQALPSAGTPRKRNKYRLKNHTPSYCDETLFGPKPGEQRWAAPWMTRSDVAKLRPLLLTPPSALGDCLVLSSHPKEIPLKAIHQEKASSQGKERFHAQHRREDSCWKPRGSCSDMIAQDALGRGRSHSLTRLCSTSDRFQTLVNKPRRGTQQDSPLPVTATGSLGRPSPQGLSGTLSTRAMRSTNSCKPKPPWK